MQVKKLTREEYEDALAELGSRVPVEQLPVWLEFEAAIPGRSPWGFVSFEDDGRLTAAASFSQYETHGYRYLRAHHGPVWAQEPTEEQEAAALEALRAFVRAQDPRQVFCRFAVKHELPATRPCLSTLPYDTTVVIDLTGGEDEILSRMKPRGRRDVRKALRECPAVRADETGLAGADFSTYYEVMRATAERDGFAPAPMGDYANMIALLGPDRCRVFAARIDGELVAWSMVTMSDGVATRYYAATTREAGRKRVADALVFFEANQVARLGCEQYDLMGIGSDFAPETKNLNEFKTKFAKDGVHTIAPDRDLPVRPGFYGALVRVKALRSRLR